MDMEIIKKLVDLSRKEYFWIIILTLLVLAMHFSILYSPDTIILDEVYYVEDARGILSGDGILRGEHPPLGGLLVTSGMFIFGDNPLGWRFFSIIIGSANIFLIYLICRQLAMSRRASFMGGFLLALENLTFVQSSIAMLDVYSLFFMFFAFWLYLKGNYPIAAVAGCLGVLCKMTGGLAFIVIGLHWLITRRDRMSLSLGSIVLALSLFFMLLTLFDFTITRELVNPLKRIFDMITASGSITFEMSSHPSLSRPWEWIIFLKTMPYNYDPDYLAVISPTLWISIIPVIGYMAYKIRKGNFAALFGILWFASTYLPWIPITLISDRATYVYYFFPVVGSICIGLGMGLSELLGLWENRDKGKLRWIAVAFFSLYIILHGAIFIVLSPVFSRWIPTIRDILL
jgi:predicted membrane-bound dolichyl-phosphate-mannose-protein mannosyltransferase